MCDIKPIKLPEISSTPAAAPRKKYLARSKLALLIGNGKYKTQKNLPAPKNDISKIGQKLRKLNFHTLICKDLNKAAMEQIIQFFINLLIEGVYGVLYFAGHGFETAEGSFLLPCDSTTEGGPRQSISITEVHKRVLEKRPKLCLILMDICRVRRDASNSIPAVVTVRPNTATMLVYATNPNMKAFESGKGDSALSLFVSHLLPLLDEDLSVRQMVTKVTDSIANNTAAAEKDQNVELRTTLASDVGLHDEVDYSGSTQSYNQSLLMWESVNKTPKLLKFPYEELGITMEVQYAFRYSNSLIVHVACVKQNELLAFKCQARIVSISPPVVTYANAQFLESKKDWPGEFRNNSKCMTVYHLEIEGIENLDMDLVVTFEIAGTNLQGEQLDKQITRNLGRPLLAALGLPNSTFDPFQSSDNFYPKFHSLGQLNHSSASSASSVDGLGQQLVQPQSMPNLPQNFQLMRLQGLVPTANGWMTSEPRSDVSDSLESRHNHPN